MSNKKEYKVCTKCIMDTTDPDITFDNNGICNHCHYHDSLYKQVVPNSIDAKILLSNLVEKIKEKGKSKKYDCIIGLSGGVDSTYVALLVKELGLRPLAVHLDNGWNSELAIKNVENVIKKLKIDLFTIVIDWEEFKALQLAYLRAGVIDLEVTSDHAIFASLYKLAKQYKLNYIIGGTNVVTESIMPKSWFYQTKNDLINLEDIFKKYGDGRMLKTYPKQGFLKLLYYNLFHKLEFVSILNYVPYIQHEIKEIIKKELEWKEYGGKHHESLITKFYQCYILPKKFGVDKRRAHLSNLICSGQMTREEALIEIAEPLYNTEFEMESDIEYVIKKFNISRDDFNKIINSPPSSHLSFKSDKWQRDLFYKIVDLKHKYFKK